MIYSVKQLKLGYTDSMQVVRLNQILTYDRNQAAQKYSTKSFRIAKQELSNGSAVQEEWQGNTCPRRPGARSALCESSEANSCMQLQLRKIHGVRQGRALRASENAWKSRPSPVYRHFPDGGCYSMRT